IFFIIIEVYNIFIFFRQRKNGVQQFTVFRIRIIFQMYHADPPDGICVPLDSSVCLFLTSHVWFSLPSMMISMSVPAVRVTTVFCVMLPCRTCKGLRMMVTAIACRGAA